LHLHCRGCPCLSATSVQSLPFAGRSKRTGFYAAVVFLNLNGLRCTGDSLAGAMLLDELADPSVGDDEADERFEAWLREHVAG